MELGKKARDIVTGFVGIITAKVVYLTGCTQYCLTPNETDKDGKIREGHYFDEQRLELIDEGIVSKFYQKNTGGPQDNTPNNY